MRLINSSTLKLHEFVGNQIPPYAILSHTWGEEEVSFQELQSNTSEVTEKKGFDKITQCCRVAANDGFEYTWIDTCCIDKTSSAELSEAINSMFRWYKRAEVCYAFLADVNSDEDPQMEESAFRMSRWFERGWTLQELIAPTYVLFLGSNWEEIGSKLSMLELVSEVTKIKVEALNGRVGLNHWSAAQKMSWASNRVTTREEDTAYCLMGIFDINMPMLYGEGEKAFMRLQEEIIKTSQDETIFAWWNDSNPYFLNKYNRGLLASGPYQFAASGDVRNLRASEQLDSTRTFTLVCDFIELRLPMIDITGEASRTSFWDRFWHSYDELHLDKYEPGTRLVMLNCCGNSMIDQKLALCLAWSGEGNNYWRIETDLRHSIRIDDPRLDSTDQICMRKTQIYGNKSFLFMDRTLAFWLRVVNPQKRQLDITSFNIDYSVGAQDRLAGGVSLPEGVRKTNLIMGFRFRSTTDIGFLVMIKLVDGGLGNDSVETLDVIEERNSRNLSETLDTFVSTRGCTDRVAKDIPSLGSVAVRLKRLGRRWRPAPWEQEDPTSRKIQLFYLHDGDFVEQLVTEPSTGRLADHRWLVEVLLT